MPTYYILLPRKIIIAYKKMASYKGHSHLKNNVLATCRKGDLKNYNNSIPLEGVVM